MPYRNRKPLRVTMRKRDLDAFVFSHAAVEDLWEVAMGRLEDAIFREFAESFGAKGVELVVCLATVQDTTIFINRKDNYNGNQ